MAISKIQQRMLETSRQRLDEHVKRFGDTQQGWVENIKSELSSTYPAEQLDTLDVLAGLPEFGEIRDETLSLANIAISGECTEGDRQRAQKLRSKYYGLTTPFLEAGVAPDINSDAVHKAGRDAQSVLGDVFLIFNIQLGSSESPSL